jgi:glycine dehydrogenase subunit 2
MKDTTKDFHQARWDEPLIFQRTKTGRVGHVFPPLEQEVSEETGTLDSFLPGNLMRR